MQEETEAMDMSTCIDCGSMLADVLQCVAIACVLAPLLAVLKRVVLGSDELVLLRIG